MVCTRNNVCICFALCKFNCRQGYLGTLPVLAGSVWLIWWRSIRGQQLLQAGKILWNLHSFFLERVWEWKTMESVCRITAISRFSCLPRGRAKRQKRSARLAKWFLINCVKLKILRSRGHKLVSVLEAFWSWDLTGVGWVGLVDALEGLRS